MNQRQHQFGTAVEAFIYPFLLLALLWSIYLIEQFFPDDIVRFGILPQSVEGIKGIFLSPLIHAPGDINHLINNSIPTAVLLSALIYFYRQIAFYVFAISWLFSGFFVWAFAENTGSYHIGFSGVIYALSGFLFVSGILRKYRPLQGVSLFVVFVYGSMIWGIFPTAERISWEGHLFGLLTGIALSYLFRKIGPQSPKYQFEIEKELGIEPPDLEGQWLENIRRAEEMERLRQEQEQEQMRIYYEYRRTNPPQDENAP